MAGLMILVSVFAAGAFAKRAATKNDIVQLQKEAVASGPGILPGSAQPALPVHPSLMPLARVPVGVSMQGGGYPGKDPVERRPLWTGLGASKNVRIDNEFVAGADWIKVPDEEPEEIAAREATAQTGKTKSLNMRKAYDALSTDIPLILELEFKDDEIKTHWDIYADDLKTDFPNLVDSALLGLFSAVTSKHVPSWTARMKGKDLHKDALRDMQVFIDKFVVDGKVTGQDCGDADWCVVMEEISGLEDIQVNIFEADDVITSNWKTELIMNKELKTTHIISDRAHTITIQGKSRFHFNAEGKIYRHSINNLDILMNNMKLEDMTLDDAKEAELFLASLANAPRAVGFNLRIA